MTRPPPAPKGLEVKGRRLWRLAHAERTSWTAAALVLLEECCRIADRLDRLALAVAGEHFADFAIRNDIVNDELVREVQVELVVRGALSEARMQARALKDVLTALGLEKAVASGVQVPVSQTAAKADPGDELERARAARRESAP